MKRTIVILLSLVWVSAMGSTSFALLPSAPTLTVATSGNTVTFSWTSVTDAAGYIFSYAPYPTADPIGSVDVGNILGGPVQLWEGAAFYVVVQAYNSEGRSDISNIPTGRLTDAILPFHPIATARWGQWGAGFR